VWLLGSPMSTLGLAISILHATSTVHAHGGTNVRPVKLVQGWAGDVNDLVAAAAVGSVAGYFTGSSIPEASVLYSQVACLVFLDKVQLVTIQWARVRALLRSSLLLPFTIVRGERRRRKQAELDRVNGVARPVAAWAGLNEHAALGAVAAFCASAYITPSGSWKRYRGGAALCGSNGRLQRSHLSSPASRLEPAGLQPRPLRTRVLLMSDEAGGPSRESDDAPISAAEALQDRLDKTGLVPTEPQGFDGSGFGGYLLPYAGGLVLTLLLTSAAFSALVLGSGSAPQ